MKRGPWEGKREIRMRRDDSVDGRIVADTGQRDWGGLSALSSRFDKRIKRATWVE